MQPVPPSGNEAAPAALPRYLKRGRASPSLRAAALDSLSHSLAAPPTGWALEGFPNTFAPRAVFPEENR